MQTSLRDVSLFVQVAVMAQICLKEKQTLFGKAYYTELFLNLMT